MNEYISKIQKIFFELTGLFCNYYPVSVLEKMNIPDGECQNHNSFCQIVRQADAGKFLCSRQIKGVLNRAFKERTWQTFFCHAGMIEIIVPVYEKGKAEGFFLAGGFCTKRDVAVILGQSRQYEKKYGVSESKLKESIENISTIHYRKIDLIGELLSVLVRMEIDQGEVKNEAESDRKLQHYYDETPMPVICGMSDFLMDASVSQEDMEMFWVGIDAKIGRLYTCVKCRYAVEGKELWREILGLAYKEEDIAFVRVNLTMIMEILFVKFYMNDTYDPRYYLIHYRVVREIWRTTNKDAFKGIMSDCFDEIFNMFCKEDRIPDASVIDKVVRFLEENYSRNITVEDAARSVRLTPSYVSKKFKQEIGMSIKTYLIDIRIKKAKELLLTTNLPVIRIAEVVGYPNQRSFFKMFMKYYGMTCNELRQKYSS